METRVCSHQRVSVDMLQCFSLVYDVTSRGRVYFRAENIYKEYDQFRAVIESTGKVHWEPGGVFRTMCEIDITYYPFDDQTCKLTFGAWSYHTGKMNLTNTVDRVNLDSYSVRQTKQI